MDVSEELLIAYADGELSGEERARVEAALASRADLQRFVEQQQALRSKIEIAFRPLLAEDVPHALRNTVFARPVSTQWRWRQAFERFAAPGSRILFWTGIPAVAALACGVILGIALTPQSAIRFDDTAGQMTAQGTLKTALETQLASTQGSTEAIRIGITFQARDRRFCRTFESNGAGAAVSGVACRSGKGWSIPALATVPRDRGEYRLAGGMPDSLRAAVSGLIVGEPLDAAGERAARDRGWTAK